MQRGLADCGEGNIQLTYQFSIKKSQVQALLLKYPFIEFLFGASWADILVVKLIKASQEVGSFA